MHCLIEPFIIAFQACFFSIPNSISQSKTKFVTFVSLLNTCRNFQNVTIWNMFEPYVCSKNHFVNEIKRYSINFCRIFFTRFFENVFLPIVRFQSVDYIFKNACSQEYISNALFCFDGVCDKQKGSKKASFLNKSQDYFE